MRGLPVGWAQTSIGEVCEVLAGYGFPIEMQGRTDEAICFYKVRDISEAWLSGSKFLGQAAHTVSLEDVEKLRASTLPKNSVVFAKIGEALRLNRRAMLREDALVDNNVMGIHGDALSPDFLFWWSVATRFDDDARASVVPSIRKGDVADLPILLPPRGEQTRIVAKLEELLSDLDAGVAELKAAQQKLQHYRQSLLKAAVEGSLTAAWREANPAPEETGTDLLARILIERRARWEAQQLAKFEAQGKAPPKGWQDKYPEPLPPHASSLPGLPTSWAWVSWSQVGFSQNGKPFPSAEYQETGAKLLRPGNLYADGSVGWTAKNTQCLPEHYLASAKDLIVGPDELVINLTAQSLKDDFLGRVCKTATGECCLLNQRLARLTPVLARTDFMHLVFASPLFRRFVASLNTGSLIQHMFTSQLENFAFPLPPLAEQAAIAEALGAQFDSLAALLGAIPVMERQSTAQRRNLLRAAFAGQLVPQDPADEPAAALLAHIRAGREAAGSASKRSSRRRAPVAASP